MTQLKPFDDLFAVPIPKGAKITEVKQVKQSACLIIETAPKEISIQPIKGNWQHLFTTESATEQDWAGVVEDIADWSDNIPKLFYNYNACGRDFRDIIESAFKTATASGHSLLAANGLDAGENYSIIKKK